MNEIGSVDELLKKAFQLAYFILGDRPASIYIAMSAMDKLKRALTTQGRRLYYTPTGRSAYPAARTKVNLSELHLLQRLVYVESELFERLIEGQRTTLQQEDLIIRYVKHLIRVTTKHNSFYVTLGLCRLLYNYSTAETSEIYNLVLQDPERIRDDYYYRSRKKRLMEDLRDRFGSLIKTQRVLRGEDRFRPQEDSQKYASLVKQCLIRFTPWQSACVLPKELNPETNVITQLLFEGGDPDKEHQVELNRIHSLIHPECFDRVIAALSLASAHERLELPTFFVSGEESRPTEDRFSPASLTEWELDAISRYLDRDATHRKQFSQTQVSLLIDGKRQSDFELTPSRSFRFDLADGSELIEIRSVGSLEEEHDQPLAVCLLAYAQSGVRATDSSVVLGKGQELSLTVLPAADPSGEACGATLTVGYQLTMPTRSYVKALQQLASWRYALTDFPRSNPFASKVALALLLITLSVIGLWIYSHSRMRSTDSQQVAKLQDDGRVGTQRFTPPSTAPQIQIEPARPVKTIRAPQTTRTSTHQRVTPGGPHEANEIDQVRGTERRPASAMLLAVKRVYVDPLGDDSFSRQLREQLMATLRVSDRFDVVNNRDDADAVLRGSTRQGPNKGPNSSVVLELVNADGEEVWSLSSRKEGRVLSSDPTVASATIIKALLHDMRILARKR